MPQRDIIIKVKNNPYEEFCTPYDLEKHLDETKEFANGSYVLTDMEHIHANRVLDMFRTRLKFYNFFVEKFYLQALNIVRNMKIISNQEDNYYEYKKYIVEDGTVQLCFMDEFIRWSVKTFKKDMKGEFVMNMDEVKLFAFNFILLKHNALYFGINENKFM